MPVQAADGIPPRRLYASSIVTVGPPAASLPASTGASGSLAGSTLPHPGSVRIASRQRLEIRRFMRTLGSRNAPSLRRGAPLALSIHARMRDYPGGRWPMHGFRRRATRWRSSSTHPRPKPRPRQKPRPDDYPRNSRRKIFPVTVLGSSSMIITTRGYLYAAIRALQYSASSSGVTFVPGLRLTTAFTVSPR